MRNMLYTYNIKGLACGVIIIISVIVVISEVFGNSFYFLDSAILINRTTFLKQNMYICMLYI